MGDIHGLAAFNTHLSASATGAFSDMRFRVHDMLTAGDKVVVRFTNSGRQTGPFMGAPQCRVVKHGRRASTVQVTFGLQALWLRAGMAELL